MNPASKLTVNGNFAVGADYNVVAPTNGAIIEGNVGIGTNSPQALLNVFNGDIYCNDATGNSSIRLITQEQNKLSEATSKISEQGKKIAEQDLKIAELEEANARLTGLATEMEALKKVVVSMQEKSGTVRKVALTQ